jgi:hypothetical protein
VSADTDDPACYRQRLQDYVRSGVSCGGQGLIRTHANSQAYTSTHPHLRPTVVTRLHMDQGYDPARSTGNIYIAGKPSERRRQPGEPLQPATPAPSNNTAAPQASLLPSAMRSLATTRGQVLVGNGEREGRSAGCRQLPPVQVSKPSPPPSRQDGIFGTRCEKCVCAVIVDDLSI